MVALPGPNFFRAGTLKWYTTFYDASNPPAPVQPPSASLHVTYTTAAGVQAQTSVAMTPSVFPQWSAILDTRNFAAGWVYWSIHSTGTDVSVEDGSFFLQANPANIPTF